MRAITNYNYQKSVSFYETIVNLPGQIKEGENGPVPL